MYLIVINTASNNSSGFSSETSTFGVCDLHTPNVDVSEENPDELFDAVLMTIKYIMRESKDLLIFDVADPSQSSYAFAH
jgi:hypothetical protein